jgi:hypothetical protein
MKNKPRPKHVMPRGERNGTSSRYRSVGDQHHPLFESAGFPEVGRYGHKVCSSSSSPVTIIVFNGFYLVGRKTLTYSG